MGDSTAVLAYVIAGFVFWGAYLTMTGEDAKPSNMVLSLTLWPLWVAMAIGAWLVGGRRK